MSVETELTAIRESAAIFPLNDRGFLRITGPDATRWLNGMVTNSIQSLAPGRGNYNFLLNAQGRIQGDCTIYRDGDSYLLETDLAQRDTIQQHLEKFIIMDDVELTPVPSYAGLRLLGPKAAACFAAADVTNEHVQSLELVRVRGHSSPVDLFGIYSLLIPGYEIWAELSAMELVEDRLREAGASEVSAEAIEAFRILEGHPKFGQDIRDRDLPQETGQTHALHFNKGCYLGQEIVERIRSRGQVHRQFTPLQLTGSLPPLPAPLEANGKPAGEITSAVQIGDDVLALGYVRREFFSETLTYAGGTAAIRHTPAIE